MRGTTMSGAVRPFLPSRSSGREFLDVCQDRTQMHTGCAASGGRRHRTNGPAAAHLRARDNHGTVGGAEQATRL